MRNLRWQLIIAVGGFLLVIGLLLGQNPESPVSAVEPVAGGVYIEALVGSPMRLNPILDFANQADRDVDRLIYSGLLQFDARGIPVPDVAESWAVSADASLYTITLREDAFWHDGERVVSDDVIYTFSKLQDDDYPGPADLHEFWKQINIIRLDARRVQFQLPEPFAPFLDYLTVGLLPDHLMRGVSAGELIDHPFNLEPVGSGPFRFNRFLTEDGQIAGVSLTAFDDFYAASPFLERVEFRYFDDTESALKAYLDGEVMGIGTVDEAILDRVLANPRLNLYSARLPEMGILFFNLKNSEKQFLAEKPIRQALAMAINRQHLIDKALNGQAVLPNGPIMPGTWAFASGLRPIPFDPERAAQMLETLEWKLPAGAAPGSDEYLRSKDDATLSLTLTYPDDPLHEAIAELIRDYWRAIGVGVELDPAEAQDILEKHLEPREFEVVLSDLNLSRSPDPDPYPFWHDSQTETGQNYTGFEDRNTSIWLEQARTNPDRGRRAELYASFQYRFQDQVPALLLYYPVYNYAVDSLVQGLRIGPLFDPSDRFSSITGWHLIARRNPVAPPATSAP